MTARRLIRLSGLVAAFLTLMVLGPVAWATLSLRSPGSDAGAEPGAWLVVAIALLLCAAAAGAAAAGLAWLAVSAGRRLRRS